MGWKEYLEQNCANYKNFVLLGEAGSLAKARLL